uniref:Uncharacterized protein n=1 Tax=Ditylenchus dipsaci TaxID=166011 RepID=A0A915EG84_9BILA
MLTLKGLPQRSKTTIATILAYSSYISKLVEIAIIGGQETIKKTNPAVNDVSSKFEVQIQKVPSGFPMSDFGNSSCMKIRTVYSTKKRCCNNNAATKLEAVEWTTRNPTNFAAMKFSPRQ